MFCTVLYAQVSGDEVFSLTHEQVKERMRSRGYIHSRSIYLYPYHEINYFHKKSGQQSPMRTSDYPHQFIRVVAQDFRYLFGFLFIGQNQCCGAEIIYFSAPAPTLAIISAPAPASAIYRIGN